MNILVIDFETTGVDPKTCRPIEVGAAIVSNDFKTVHETYSSFIYSHTHPKITSEVEELTGISNDLLVKEGRDPLAVFGDIFDLVEKYDVKYMLAYNREFDENVYKEEIRRIGIHENHPHLAKPAILPWLCAMRDVRSHTKYKCWKLSHLALDYGVLVDPSVLHRALGDVRLTIALLDKAGADAETLYRYQKMPRFVLEALTTPPWKDGGVSTAKAKEKGYSWEVPRGHQQMRLPKRWVKVVLEDEINEALGETDFQVRKVHI